MEMCRACLLSENNMIPLDEEFVYNYNLFTNLNVTLCDGLPQSSCQNCTELLKVFIAFRTKAVASESTLRNIVENMKPDYLQFESKLDIVEYNLKQEIKTEIDFEAHSVEEYICNNSFSEHIMKSDNKDKVMDFNSSSTTTQKKKKSHISKKKNKSKTRVPDCEDDQVKVKCRKKKTEVVDKSLCCGLCKKTFEEGALNSHLEAHKKYTECEICSERFQSWQQMFGHRVQHLPSKQRKCHICNKRYTSCYGMEYHYLSIHSDKQDVSIKCKFCLKPFPNLVRLRKHIAYAHSTTEHTFICDYCSKRCKSKQNLRCHLISHMAAKAFTCQVCGFSCNFHNGLKNHMIRKHCPDKVTCHKCKRIFESQEKHDKHTCAARSYICPICGKELDSSNSARLSRHLATHEPEGRHKCGRCARTYRSAEALRVHVNRHDGVRGYACEYCPAKFYSASSRIRHRRTHTGEKPYVCEICSRAFMCNSNLKMHMKIHGLFVINHRNKVPENNTEPK